MEHVDIPLGEMHRAHNYEYADATARLAATGFVAGDVRKLALQLSDMTFWILSAATPTWAFAGEVAVNSVTNAKLADVATATLKGRVTAATGDPEDLTAAQARTLLNVADGATANAADAALRDRATHTGTQAAVTITGLAAVATSGLKADVGLGSVDNTSDSAKPVSTDQAAADTAALNSAKAYADGLVVGLWDDRGSYNASVNTYPAAGGSGTAGAVLKGDIWTVSVVGTLGGVAVAVGDSVRAVIDAPAQVAANWAVLENNIGYVPENLASKDASGGYPGLTLLRLNLRNAANTITSWFTSEATSAWTWLMPNKSGTVAMTSDITGTNSGTNTGDQTASTVANTPAGNIEATTVQAALNELDDDKSRDDVQLTYILDYALDQAGMANKRVTDATNYQTQTGTASFTQTASTEMTRTYATATVSLPKAYKNTDYQVVIDPVSATPVLGFEGEIKVQSRAVNSFVLQMSGSATACSVRWKTLHPNAENRVHVVLPTAQ